MPNFFISYYYKYSNSSLDMKANYYILSLKKFLPLSLQYRNYFYKTKEHFHHNLHYNYTKNSHLF